MKIRFFLFFVFLLGCQTNPDPTEQFRSEMRSELTGRPGVSFVPIKSLRTPRVEEYFQHWKFREIEHPWGGEVTAWEGLLPFQDGDLFATVFLPPGPPRGTLFIIHGYLASMGNFSGIIRVMLEEGWAIASLDLPGHGLSSGVRADIKDFRVYGEAVQTWLDALHPLQQNLPHPWVALGHSTGGSSFIEHTRHFKAPWDLLILSAPLIHHVYWELGQSVALLNGWWLKSIAPIVSPDSLVGIYAVPTNWANALGRWSANLELSPNFDLPVILHQDTTDQVVDWKYNLPLCAKGFPNNSSIFSTGMGHVTLADFDRYREAFGPILEHILENVRASAGVP